MPPSRPLSPIKLAADILSTSGSALRALSPTLFTEKRLSIKSTSTVSETGTVNLTRLPPIELVEERHVPYFDGLRSGCSVSTLSKPVPHRAQVLSLEGNTEANEAEQTEAMPSHHQLPVHRVHRVHRVHIPDPNRPFCNYQKHQQRAQELRAAGKLPAYVNSGSAYIDPFREEQDSIRIASAKAKAMHGALFKPGGKKDEWHSLLTSTGVTSVHNRIPKSVRFATSASQV